MKPLQAIWPKIPAPFVRAMLAGHSALGLAFAALIYVVCLTGSFIVLERELHRWEAPTVAPSTEAPSPQAIERMLTEVLARYEGVEHIFLMLPDADLPRTSLYVDLHEGEEDPELTASNDGALLDTGATPFTQFLTRLHINLLLPQSWGIFIVGATGVALLSSLVSGLFAHPRVFRDAFYLRWGGSKRLQEADLHNRIGVWGLPFHLTISLTGALLGISTVIVGILALILFQGDMDRAYGLFLPPAPIDNPAPAALPSLEPMFAEIAQRAPDATVRQLVFEHPREMGQTITFYVSRPDQLSYGDAFTFNGAGELTNVDILAEASLGLKVLQAISMLHFGWFGGWFIKIAYLVLGLGLTAVTSSGVAIWLARRRDKGRPAPRWERIWIATVWSQPFAYVLCASVAVIAPSIPMTPLWLVATSACAGLLGFSPERISKLLRAATSALLFSLVGAHALKYGSSISDPMAWGLNIVLVATGLILATTLLTRVKRSVTRQDLVGQQ